MKIEMTENEAVGFYAEKWMNEHWKRAWLPLWATLIIFFGVSIALGDVSMWVSILPGIAIILPGAIIFLKGVNRSRREARKILANLKNG